MTEVAEEKDLKTAKEMTGSGNYELQRRVAMLNRLCEFHLNRATSIKLKEKQQ